MASQLIENLLHCYQPEQVTGPRVQTVRALLDLCCAWLDGEILTSDLAAPCDEMAEKLSSAALESREELKASEICDQEVLECLQTTAEGYSDMAISIKEFLKLALADQAGPAETVLDRLDQIRESVLDAQAVLKEIQEEDVLRCARCYIIVEDLSCPACALLPMYLDYSVETISALGEVSLPQELMKTRSLVFASLSGEAGLQDLLAELPQAYQYFKDIEDCLDGLLQNEAASVSGREKKLKTLLQGARNGLHRFETVLQNRRASEIVRGWNETFYSIRALQRMLAGESLDSTQFRAF